MANDYVELLRLGRRIQTERKILGFSQNGFAKDCGLNRSCFGGIERGERNLNLRDPLQDLQRTSLRYLPT